MFDGADYSSGWIIRATIGYNIMIDQKNEKKPKILVKKSKLPVLNVHQPLWASALEQVYASVIHEPLPDSFIELLEKLDTVCPPEAKPDAEH